MSSAITAVAVGVGLKTYGDYKSASGQAKAAKAAGARTSALAEQEFDDFNVRKEAWEDMYGSTEKNLASTIKNMTARSYEVAGHTNLEKQYSDTSRRLSENFAARGISGGIPSQAAQYSLNNLARDKATVSSNAPRQAFQDQANAFLKLGLSGKPNEGEAENKLYNRQQGASQQLYQGDAGKAAAIGGAISGVGSMASAYGGAMGNMAGASSAVPISGSTSNWTGNTSDGTLYEGGASGWY